MWYEPGDAADMRHVGEFGTVTVLADRVAVTATERQLRAWARRPGMVWPCSALARIEQLRCEFDSGGLLDLTVRNGDDDVPADEFNAWSSDVLRDVLPADHPARFVTVDQFEGT